MPTPMTKWGRRLAIVGAAVVGYVVVMGTTGYCPICTGIMDRVLGRSDTPIEPGAAKASIAELKVYDLEGQPVSLAAYVGKPTIIDVWATWCPPCRTQRNVIHDLDAEFLKTVNIVSLSTDRSPAEVKSFIANHPSNITDLMSSPEALQAFGGVRSIPTLVFVDPAGRVRDVGVGVHSASELKRRVLGLSKVE